MGRYSIFGRFGRFLHFCLLMGNLFTTSLLLLMKMVSLGAVAMISLKRKLLLAISTPFSQHLPQNSIFGHFSPIVLGVPKKSALRTGTTQRFAVFCIRMQRTSLTQKQLVKLIFLCLPIKTKQINKNIKH